MRTLTIILFLTAVIAGVNPTFSQTESCSPDPSKRTRITSLDVPNSFTCYLELTRGRSTRYGTGMLIHPRVILTAGHNLAYYPSGTVKEVNAYFGSIDSINYLTMTSLKLRKGKNKFHKRGYWYNGKLNRDFAIIILPDSSVYKEVGGHFKIKPITQEQFLNKEIHITGSPGDKNLFEMWTASTLNYSQFQDHLKYDLFTQVRNSGSPIWIDTKEGYEVVGIHSRSYGNCNAAILINNEAYQQITKWCKEAGIEL
jgi:V8-like Glu-specific endopeptidase